MMEFPREFFLDELREGFYIPAMMKRAWAAELEILVEIDRICDKYKLRYYIDYGNLLGAIRHKGFIPWDDDIDIMMMRRDYEIFAEVANAELPKELVFRSPEDDSGNCELFSSVQHRDMLISTDAIGKYHNYLYGAGVDIFPYDYLAKDPDKEKQREDILKSLCILASFPSMEGENQVVLKEEAKKVKNHYGVDLFHSSDYRKTVLNLLNDCFKEFNQEGNTRIAYLLDLILYKEQGKSIFEEQWYEEQSYLDFEFLALPVPKEYQKVISEKYDDYKQIKKAGGAHDYPLYRKMEAAYRKGIGGKLFYEYSISKNDLKNREYDFFHIKEINNSLSQKPYLFFLPSLYTRWESMKGLFFEARKDDSVDCFIMPLPYYNRVKILSVDKEIKRE